MTFNEALDLLGEDESFRATIYSMNTLLIKKGVYKSSEFEQLFCEYAINAQRGFKGARAESKSVVVGASL